MANAKTPDPKKRRPILIGMTIMLPYGSGRNRSAFPSEQCKTVGLIFEESQMARDKIAGSAGFPEACLSAT
jgi:hypothetical protein